MKLSDEELEVIVRNSDQHSTILVSVSRELLALRKAFSEPVAEVVEQGWFSEDYAIKAETDLLIGDVLYRKPAKLE